jgi:hypothetical protein
VKLPWLKTALLIVAGLLLLVPIAVAVHAGVYNSWFDGPASGYGMWGAFALYLGTRPRRIEWLALVLVASALRFAHMGLSVEHPYPGYLVVNIGAYLPFFFLPILGWRAAKGPDRLTHQRYLTAASVIFLIGLALDYYLSFARGILPWKFDNLLYAFDGSLGSHPGFALASFAAKHWLLAEGAQVVYDSLGLVMVLVLALQLGRPNGRIEVLKAFIANAILGVVLYSVYPAMGPKYAFPSFPTLPEVSPAAIPVLLDGIPNAMPSLHATGAFLAFFLATPWPWLRRLTACYLAATVTAILVNGEHYLVDAIVALPYAIFVLAYASRIPGRRFRLASAALFCAGWLATLRTGNFHPWISWGLFLITIAWGSLVARRLARQIWGPVSENQSYGDTEDRYPGTDGRSDRPRLHGDESCVRVGR